MHDDLTLPLDDSQPLPGAMPLLRESWGPFRLSERVGSGGFGEVYRAWDPNLEREVALKLLLPGLAGGEEEYKAMLREARAMASVQHPNIVHVYGIDRHDGRVGFWTDFVKGKTLSALLKAQGPFGYREAALIGIDLSRALSAVHRAGLLHRDIKSENVMREEGGRILLMDFGLSAGERGIGGQIAGTPNYMAPELFEGGKATTCTDIYAMGVLLYYLVIGEYPARLSGLSALEARAALARRKPLMDLRSDLPEPFLRTVRLAMELNPSKRFTSAGELAESLAMSLDTSEVTPRSWSSASDVTSVFTVPAVLPLPPPPPPPPPPAAAHVPGTWKNLFGGIEWFSGLSRKTKWALLGIIIFTFQKTWRSSTPPPSRKGGSAAVAPATPFAPGAPGGGTPGGSDSYLKAAGLLQRPYKESNVAEAIKGFQQVLQDDPNSALAYAGLASAYFTQYNTAHDAKLLALAQAANRRALEIDPKLAQPYANLARIEAAQGHTDLALEHAEKAIALDPRSAEAYGALGLVYKSQGRIREAIDALQKAVDLAPEESTSPWVVRLGNLYFSRGDLKQAAEEWAKGVELDPENVNAQANLGLVDMQLGKLAEAHEALQKAVDMQPNAANYSALGNVLMQEGKYKEAVEMDQKAVNVDPNDYRAWGNLGSAYQWSGANHDKAMQSYVQAIKVSEDARTKTPDDPSLLSELADFYASTGDAGHAVPLVRRAMARAPDDPHVAYRAGETYEILGQRSKAIPLIAQALAQGYNANEFERSPELASLRGDLTFQVALTKAKAQVKK